MVKNIIKRIIVGVGIALVLMAIKGNLLIGASAKQISSIDTGGLVQVVNNLDSGVEFLLGGGYWNNWGPGYLHFAFSVNKVDGSSTSPLVLPRSAIAQSNGIQYICDIGSLSQSNSTFTGSVYSATCPMNMGSNGLERIYIRLFDNQQNSLSTYRFVLTNALTYEQADSSQVNIDISSINNKLQQQIQNDNTNTQSIVNSQQQTTNAINDTNNTLKDDSVDNNSISSTIQNGSSQIASNNSITQLLTLPISLYQNILNSVSGSCSSFSLGSLYNHTLTLPCINLQNLLGSTLYGIIDILISGLFILSFRKKMVDIFNNMTSLKDRGNELE